MRDLAFSTSSANSLAALCAEGKSEIMGIENIEDYFENFVGKLEGLGARIWKQ